MKKIICIHLFNDYSGSPLVLSTSIKSLVKNGFEVELLTSKGTTGFLSGLKGVSYRQFAYRFYENKVLRLGMLLWSQLNLFLMMAKYRGTGSMIYINTLLPFGAALGARFWNLRVVYHLHETTVNPPVLKRFLKAVARHCASGAIYVSRFLQRAEPLEGVPSTVVYNSLDSDFVKQAGNFCKSNPPKSRKFTVLMLCSLKAYKGVDVYVRLAATLPQYQFLLVLNSDMESIRAYFTETNLPQNLVIFPSAKSVHSFYEEAHVVLNLSHPVNWVETFGMTLLEGMAYGLPVIGPPVGGPAEIIRDGYNGFQVDQRNVSSLLDKLSLLAGDPLLYQRMAGNATSFAANFDEEKFTQGIIQAVNEKDFENIASIEYAA